MSGIQLLLAFLIIGFITSADADDVNIRIILAPRTTAEAMKQNLDPGSLPAEKFEEAYTRMVDSRQLEELFRFKKANFTDKQNFVLQSAGAGGSLPTDIWETSIEMIVTGSPSTCHLMFARESHPPKDDNTPAYGAIKSWFSTQVKYNSWQVIDEATFGGKVLQTLIQVVKTDSAETDPFAPRMVADGYFVSLPGKQATALEGQSSDQLAGEIKKIIAANIDVNSFRFGANPGSKATYNKGSVEGSSYDLKGLKENTGSNVEIEVVQSSGDKGATWRCVGQVLQAQPEGKPQALDFPVTDFFPVGEWKALVINRGTNNPCPVLFINIRDLTDK